MAKIRLSLFSLIGAAHAFSPATPSLATRAPCRAGAPALSAHPLGRRALASALGAAAVASALPVWANTAAELGGETQSGFEAGQEKRAAFQKKQKSFKKAWRKQLSELEFSQNDEEATVAVDALFKLVIENGGEIPEGVRKMDLDQVYKTVKPKLGKTARMNFAKLDKLVLDIVTVKNLKGFEGAFEF